MAARGRHALLVASATISLLLSQACLSVRKPSFMAEPATRDWPATLSLARQRAAAARIEAADSLLAAFSAKYPGTPESSESLFWRAVLELDPANRVASNANALALLDAYLSKAPNGEHRTEAATLRRVAGHLDGLTKLAASAMSNVQDANAAAANANARAAEARAGGAKAADMASQDAEIKRLRDELAKANAELERIRRRLAQPPE